MDKLVAENQGRWPHIRTEVARLLGGRIERIEHTPDLIKPWLLDMVKERDEVGVYRDMLRIISESETIDEVRACLRKKRRVKYDDCDYDLYNYN